jgi:hypothetical protein
MVGRHLLTNNERTKMSYAGKIEELIAERDRLRVALRFYARSEHYLLDEAEEFDTVSGEPPNWLMSGREGSQTMVEDGQIARCALWGVAVSWVDGDDDTTPQPIDGEQSVLVLPND